MLHAASLKRSAWSKIGHITEAGGTMDVMAMQSVQHDDTIDLGQWPNPISLHNVNPWSMTYKRDRKQPGLISLCHSLKPALTCIGCKYQRHILQRGEAWVLMTWRGRATPLGPINASLGAHARAHILRKRGATSRSMPRLLLRPHLWLLCCCDAGWCCCAAVMWCCCDVVLL